MNQAQREIQQIVERFTSGAHGQISGGVDRYRAEFERDLAAVIKRHGAKQETVATLKNGIRTLRISDARGEVVAEYHDAPV